MANDNIQWSSDEMIENASNWSLAGDVALLNSLKKFSETLISDTESLNNKVDNLLNNLENVNLKLELTKNEFQSLKNTQFIENRVYEDDETFEGEEKKIEEKVLTDEDKENLIKRAITNGLKVMEKFYNKVEVAVSDSEGESNEKNYILQPKDPYTDRHLPYLVGTPDWYQKWHAGLLPSDSESESVKDEDVFSSSSDSEENLPKNRPIGSETSSELSFTTKNSGPVANSTFNDSEDRRREVFHSSDECLEQSNSVPFKTPISNENFAEQLAAKLGDVIIAKNNLPESNSKAQRTKPAKHGNQPYDEPPPLDDLEDTILPKSAHEGLFSTGRNVFDENNEEDLFWGEVNIPKPTIPSTSSNKNITKGLFENSDSEEDMVTVTEKRRILSNTASNPYMPLFKPTTVPFVDEQPPEIKPESKEKIKKKPIGGVSVFGANNADIFNEKSLINPKEQNEKLSIKKTSLFDESSDEDMFVAKTNEPKLTEKHKNLSLFDDSDDSTTKNDDTYQKLNKFVPSKEEVSEKFQKSKTSKKKNIFVDEIKEFVPKSTKTSIFDDEPPKVNEKSKISLFDDDDDDDLLKEEEDIFASLPKKINKFDDLNKSTKPAQRLFDDDILEESKNKTSLFDVEDVPETVVAQNVGKKSLFDEDLASNNMGNTRNEFVEKEEEISEKWEPSDVRKEETKDIYETKDNNNFSEIPRIQPENLKKESLEKIKKPLGLFDSDNEKSSDKDENIFAKDNEEQIVDMSQILKSDPSTAAKNYSLPPPINLFDPTPPPVDWEASSDNSGESDTFSLTDGILDRTNYNQSQPSSNVFDEAPPSLDVNDMNYSSGIVKDINVTRVETDDSSFYPYASSSRRLSSDIFNDQQSQDSFFVTKNRTENTQQSNLQKISETSDETISKIENLTPSGNFDEFEGNSSVFKNVSSEMDPTKADKLFGNGDSEQKGIDKKSNLSTVKASPGRLKHNLNINVGALLPGAAPPKTRPSISKSTSLDETDKSGSLLSTDVISMPKSELIDVKSEDDVLKSKIGVTQVLQSVTKDRARIQVKRRPSTRKARQESARKSMINFYSNSEPILTEAQTPAKIENTDQKPDGSCDESVRKSDFTEELQSAIIKDTVKNTDSHEELARKSDVSEELLSVKIETAQKNHDEPAKSALDDSNIKKGTFESPNEATKGISLVFDKKDNLYDITNDDIFETMSKPQATSLFNDLDEKSNIFSNSIQKSITSENEGPKNLFDTSKLERSQKYNDSDIFKSKPRIFDDEDNQSDEDIFSSNSKFKKISDATIASTSDESRDKGFPKTENIATTKASDNENLFSSSVSEEKLIKKNIFSESDSDSDSELFGGKLKTDKQKIVEVAKKTTSLFDSDDSTDDDLFGTKIGRSNTTADKKVAPIKQGEIKTSNIKKLENSREITDFDPLSGFK